MFLKQRKIRQGRLSSKVDDQKVEREKAAQERIEQQRLQTEAEEKQKEDKSLRAKEQELSEALELLKKTKPEKRIDASLVKDSREPPERFLRRVVGAVNDEKYSPDTIICLGFATGSGTGYRLYIKCRTKGLEEIVLGIIEKTRFSERLKRCKSYPYITMYGTREDDTDKLFIAQQISSGLTEFAH